MDRELALKVAVAFDRLRAAYWQEETVREQAMDAFMVKRAWLLR